MGYLIPSLFLFKIMKYKDIYRKNSNLVIEHGKIDKEVVGSIYIFTSKKSFIDNNPDATITDVPFSGEETTVVMPESISDLKLFLFSININDESIKSIYADKSFIYIKILEGIENILNCCGCNGLMPHIYKLSPLIYLSSQMAKEGDLLTSYELFKKLLNISGESITEPTKDSDNCCSIPVINGRLHE